METCILGRRNSKNKGVKMEMSLVECEEQKGQCGRAVLKEAEGEVREAGGGQVRPG